MIGRFVNTLFLTFIIIIILYFIYFIFLIKYLLQVILFLGTILSIVLPYFYRTYILFGFNRADTEISNGCKALYPDKLIGCEDMHMVNTPHGQVIYLGCANSLSQRVVNYFVFIISSFYLINKNKKTKYKI